MNAPNDSSTSPKETSPSLASLGARLKKEPIAFQAETQMPREQASEETGHAKFSLIDLLSSVGLENVSMQMLCDSLVEARNVKSETRITFLTREVATNDLLYEGKSKVGLIVWIKREAWDGIVNRRKALSD